MTPEQKQAVLEALKFYIPIAAPHKPDTHIVLLEQVVVELEAEVPQPPDEQELFNESL
jgi:hypothetical protein